MFGNPESLFVGSERETLLGVGSFHLVKLTQKLGSSSAAFRQLHYISGMSDASEK